MIFLLQRDVSRADLSKLVEAAQGHRHDDSPEMAEILRRFEGLAVNICGAIKTPAHLWDDLLNAARFGLVNAVRHHDGQPGFPAFARLYMRGAALRELARWIVPETAHTGDLDELHAGRCERDEVEEVDDRMAPWGSGPVAVAIAQLGDDQRNIIELRYRRDLPVKEIAAAIGTSGPAVSQRLGTIHRRVALALAA